jgi:hypothetical protein
MHLILFITFIALAYMTGQGIGKIRYELGKRWHRREFTSREARKLYK